MLEDKLGIEVSTEPDRRFIKVYGHTLDKYEPFRDAKTLYKKVGIFKNAIEVAVETSVSRLYLINIF